MFLRFFIFIFSLVISVNAQANISADDITLTVDSFYTQSQKNQKIINNFLLKIELPEGWYTYYKNGGDAAKGPEIKIESLAENISLSPLFFTLPTKYEEQGFISYIYKGSAFFNFQLLNNSAKNIEGESLNLNAKLQMLVCKNICMPIEKSFSINTELSNNALPNANYFKHNVYFPAKQATVFDIQNNYLYIKLNSAETLKTALFIPDEDGFINDNAKQEIINKNNSNYLKIELDEYFSKQPQTISGMLATNINTFKIEAKKEVFDLQTSSEKALQLALIALFALIGGVILNLMPCVLPVIGLKVFALLKHTSLKERLKGALSYAAGVFTSMMIIVGLLIILKSLGNELAWGFQLQNKYFIGFMIALLMLIGLNLLGIFEFGNSISNKANKLNMKYSGDFFTGILTTLVATPCTAPFMATSLGFALTSDSNIITFIIFAFLAIGIFLPVLVIAIIPKAHKILPKPGSWSERLKQFLAFPIFATVIWLVWVLDSGSYIITLCLSGVFIASFIGWNLTLKSTIKYLNIIIIITLSLFAIYSHTNKEEPSLQYNKELIKKLTDEGQNVFVDFTAKWCLTCQYNKKSVLDLTETRALFYKYDTEFMVADWTNKNPEITKELELLGRSGVPVYVIYPAYGAKPILLPEILTKNTIKKYLEEL